MFWGASQNTLESPVLTSSGSAGVRRPGMGRQHLSVQGGDHAKGMKYRRASTDMFF